MGNFIPPAPGNCCRGEIRTSKKKRFASRKISFLDGVGVATSSDGSQGSSGTSEHSKSHTPTPSLRENMMRERKNHDPLLFYKMIEVLGTGSMGSVCKVRKRPCMVGGSARTTVGNGTKHRSGELFLNRLGSLPIVGECVKLCMGAEHPESLRSLKSPNRSISSRSSGGFGGWLGGRKDLLQLASRGNSSILSVDSGSVGSQYAVFYALKAIHLNRVHDPAFVEELKNEIEILKTLDHPHIVRPIETFEHRKRLFMVMELCDGGDLYSRDPYSEDEAARITHDILSAVAYMHAHNVIHRDLKYENIMFANPSPTSEIKIIDFGLSKKYVPEDPNLSEGVGTIYTMAPQVLKGDYTSQADVWSVGVLAYMLLSSQMPFYGAKRRHVIERIMNCKYEFKGRRWNMVSKQAKSFVSDLLQFAPDDRPTAAVALRNNWLFARGSLNLRETTRDNIQASMELYADYSKLKKLALMVIAHKSTSEEIGFLRKAFQRYDTETDGMLSFAEFEKALEDYGYSHEELENMFHGADLDGTGKIRYTEFLAATIEAHGAINEERLAEAFDRLDSDDSGYISTKNLREMFGGELLASDIDVIIDEADITKDGQISYAEFLALWDQQQEGKRESALRHIETRKSTLSSAANSVSSSERNETSMKQHVIFERVGKGEVSDDYYIGRFQFYAEKKQSERRLRKSI